MGFMEELEYILKKVEGMQNIYFFSASFNSDAEQLSKRYIKNPVKVIING